MAEAAVVEGTVVDAARWVQGAPDESTQIPGSDAQLDALSRRRDTALADVLAAGSRPAARSRLAEEAEFWSSPTYERSGAWHGEVRSPRGAWGTHNAAIWRERADASARGLDGTDPRTAGGGDMGSVGLLIPAVVGALICAS
ncbi:hypothetical protein HBB16_13275 [Pseudonocardia sp. MCCB 268]|nr:hypothetical protein [Pseudonocardia cytotoxica]